MRRSKPTRIEKRKLKKEQKTDEYYNKFLGKKYDNNIIKKIKEDKNILVRSDGQLFCNRCIDAHSCGLHCWCCAGDDDYPTYEAFMHHMNNAHKPLYGVTSG